MKIKKHKWYWLKGCLLGVVAMIIIPGIAIVFTYLALFFPLFLRRPLGSILTILTIIGVWIPVFFCHKLALKARKLNAQTRIKKRSSKRKPEVIYLRPFQSDQLLGDFVSTFSPITYEEQISAVLSDFGNVFAINPPKKDLYDLGAYRIDFGIDDWQEKVIEMLSSAKLIVLLAGVSPGILWEFSWILTMADLTKVIILVPYGSDQYKVIREKIKSETDIQLPEYQRGGKCPGDLVGIIYFTPDRRPHFRKFNKEFAKSSYRTPLKPVLKMAMEPVYRQLKVKWKKPPSIFWVLRVKPVLIKCAKRIRWICCSSILLLILFFIFKEVKSCVNYNFISVPPCPTCREAQPAIDELIKPFYKEFIKEKFPNELFISGGLFVFDSFEMNFNHEIQTRFCKAKIWFGIDRRNLIIPNKRSRKDNRDSIVFKVTPLGYRFWKGITYKVEIINVVPAPKNKMLLELIGKENTGIVEDSRAFFSTD